MQMIRKWLVNSTKCFNFSRDTFEVDFYAAVNSYSLLVFYFGKVLRLNPELLHDIAAVLHDISGSE